MARNMYGATSADFTLTSGGRVVPGATMTLWTARTGGTQITDLRDRDNVAATSITSGADGSIVYYGPDGDADPHWADTGVGSRIAVRPVNITGEAGPGSGILTTKGDILVRNAGADTRLPVGADGKLLIADSTQTTGLGWVSVGNLLSPNQASGTNVLSDTTGFAATNATITSSTDYAYRGSRSVKVVATADCSLFLGTDTTSGSNIAVLGGRTYTVAAFVKSETITKTFVVRFNWYTAGITPASTPTTTSSTITLSPTWTRVGVTAKPPSDAAIVRLSFHISGVDTAGDTYYLDAPTCHLGAGGVWEMPGVPVPNLGIRTDPANGSQVQVWNDDAETWITV